MDMNEFSKKQLLVLSWYSNEKFKDSDGIICDGAVRSGKTFSMSLSFVLWSMSSFQNASFAFCGKTITSLRRNLIEPLISYLLKSGFSVKELKSKNRIDISRGRFHNRYYLFGGKDEGSASLIQGVTLSGILLDEVVLMPRSFVEQAIARCSKENSKLWFNCNPDNPYHWFKKEWIDKAKEKNLLYIRFTLDDNPGLSPSIKKRYKALFSGAFYDRFVLGKWSSTYGLVYPDFKNAVVRTCENCYSQYVVSCDYGTVNPSSFGLWGCDRNGVWVRIREYYFDSRKEGFQKTDEEHYSSLCSLLGGIIPDCVIIDPSAASFIECINRHGKYKTVRAKNDVVSGIRQVSDAIKQGKIKICEQCVDSIRESELYRWDEKSGKDAPLKENDHAMDDIRYFVSTFLSGAREDFFCISLDRKH
ncbi:MAG: PBSX family phage terminase large subunit [Ruminococcus sp.]|nr:PBSX family phage terminase large subunit [Ruminococcus sp.]